MLFRKLNSTVSLTHFILDTTASSPIDKALPEIELLEKDIAETKTRGLIHLKFIFCSR